jgi:hypothetical protein
MSANYRVHHSKLTYFENIQFVPLWLGNTGINSRLSRSFNCMKCYTQDGHAESRMSSVWNDMFLLRNVMRKQNLLPKHSVAFTLHLVISIKAVLLHKTQSLLGYNSGVKQDHLFQCNEQKKNYTCQKTQQQWNLHFNIAQLTQCKHSQAHECHNKP